MKKLKRADYKKEGKVWEENRGREINLPFTGSLTKWPRLGQQNYVP